MYRYWFRNDWKKTSLNAFHKYFDADSLGDSTIGWLRGTGYYAKHLNRLLQYFPRERIYVAPYNDLCRRPLHFYEQLQHFLEVEFDGSTIKNCIVNDTPEPRSRLLHVLIRKTDSPLLRSSATKNFYIIDAIKKLRNAIMNANLKRGRSKAHIPADLYTRLVNFYHEDITSLEELLHCDFEGWRSGNME
jgi:hypothetical protein